MKNSNTGRAAILTLILVILFVSGWEYYVRHKGMGISYDDDENLWSDKRAMIYEPKEKATVLIGSSRNKYDIDIPTWKALTGDHPIQLAMVGTSPLPILNDLAKDEKFNGKLIIDVTELLFFSTSLQRTAGPNTNINYFKKRTPAQRFSFAVDHFLESSFIFLDKDNLSLNAMLDKVPLPSRKDVFSLPYPCPMEFDRVTFDRQNFMTPKFLTDTNLQNQVKGLWAFYRQISKDLPLTDLQIDSLITTVKNDVNKIKGRGGEVIFVRSPSSGPFLMGEKIGYPRQKYWDRLLELTGCQGIHFADYPAIDHFECPEFSHLKRSDAVIYTTNLVNILQQKGWVFPLRSKI